MNRRHVFDSFQFYDQAIAHNKIESQARIQADIVVDRPCPTLTAREYNDTF